nr:MAG TPA: hypothetical protein [Caudoviricetes sp.]DAS26240.1 MAG TPA: hypothetical protein [Caudoviricetes sp.]
MRKGGAPISRGVFLVIKEKLFRFQEKNLIFECLDGLNG